MYTLVLFISVISLVKIPEVQIRDPDLVFQSLESCQLAGEKRVQAEVAKVAQVPTINTCISYKKIRYSCVT